ALGWIDQMPRIIGVQAEGSAAMYHAWKSGTNPADMAPIDAQTIADSISAGLPRDRMKAMNAVTQTEGAYLTVSDDEIIAVIPALARNTGIFAEPAAAATYAGLLKAVDTGLVGGSERVVVLITGNGLKDITSAQKSVPQAPVVAPNLVAVDRIVSEIFNP
nr:pyridoxal-phosphate dependent enzyme [Anaerolineae bacterium]